MPQILLVDDSPTDREIVSRLLRNLGHEVREAEDGQQALELMRSGLPDLVLSDLMMPDLNGLELLQKLRAEWDEIPVVLMTSRGSEVTAVQALRQGAAGYVPKDRLEQDLLEVVQTALDASRSERRQTKLLQACGEQSLRFQLGNDPRTIPAVVNLVQARIRDFGRCSASQLIQIGVALEEALMNAMVHGNLEISSQLRERMDGSYERLIEQRIEEAPYQERSVEFRVQIDPRGVDIAIQDEGPGFDVQALPDPTDPENLSKPSGRGVLLIRTFMDAIEYNDRGNRLQMRKAFPAEQA